MEEYLLGVSLGYFQLRQKRNKDDSQVIEATLKV